MPHVHQPAVHQPAVHQPAVHQPAVHQPAGGRTWDARRPDGARVVGTGRTCRPARVMLGACAGAGILVAAVPTVASAQPGAGSSGRPQRAGTVSGLASLRGADLSPDTSGVVISLRPMSGGASMDLSGAASYGRAGAYRQVSAGRYQVSLRQVGRGATRVALLTWDFQAQAGAAYTVAAVGKGQQRRGVVLRDDLTPPARGTARVRLIQAASGAVKADVTADGTITLARNAPFPSVTGYAQVPAGTWPVAATTGGANAVSTQTKVSLQPGSVTSLLLLDAPGGGLALRSAVDSVGAATMPRGGVNTGGGGTATLFVGRPSGAGTPWGGSSTGGDAQRSLAVAGGLALAAGAALARVGLRRRRAVPLAAR